MPGEQQAAEFDITEARRVLGDVFAPWVRDLGLSVQQIECEPPAGPVADWQPGATLRMAFSERLCRHGGIVCGQALMALADTSMVIAILAANRGYQPDVYKRQNMQQAKRPQRRWRCRIGAAGGVTEAGANSRPHH